MSYLLDALKQSQQSDMSAEQYDLQSEQLKQQQALKRYRRLALVFGTSLAAFIAVAGGFTTGKWLQGTTLLNTSEPAVIKVVESEKSSPKEQVKEVDAAVEKQQIAKLEPAKIAPNNTATIEGQLVHVQTPNGVQQMLLTPNGQYIPMPSSPVTSATGYNQQNVQQVMPVQNYNQPVFNPQNNYNPNNTQNASVFGQSQNTASAQLDMSKYKVLGKPINGNNQSQQMSDPELDEVPTTLKNAFAQAIQDVEKNQDYEVTHASKTSSRVEPVELLPDGLQSMLPSIKYQAHIYSSSADKRWIKLNGRELHEGESIGALTVREITPEQSVLDFDGYEFSLKALQDWPQ
ncbi:MULTISPECIES: general secretion pathway protein GspB [unclassified Pseudoalteromonas]|uniref:general secretion pathway protein GspB n=1 Tax=unclassified Pseudoalteromonas TaxID=194690 RepID=UPI000CCAFEC8|nr:MULTISPECIES: general secretion pathway protein GspB [unclassified Pseudoalteromonas]MBG9989702.1 general secretion pathway protein GspB [Pseudoalteromonas sp. NZS37]MBH0078477.1 general secretion pathway protein GspB [Pseudoalteromonas sp. NZS11]PLT26097.1 general secretion pathway protein GspB [Pseudoalteromonas sp. MelDa3]